MRADAAGVRRPQTVLGENLSASCKLPVSRPLLPTFDALEPWLRDIDADRWYSNFGTLTRRFEDEVAAHFGLEDTCVTATGSGFLAITAALLSIAGRASAERPYCLCPAHTFGATATAIQSAGYIPYFVDCDPVSWALEPHRLVDHPALSKAGAVVAVAPYGRGFDMRAWEAFSHTVDIPVVIDAAAGFDTLEHSHFSARIPVCLSFHATKFLGVGEGGAVVLKDRETAWRCHQVVNNGKAGSQAIAIDNINGKMSEYAAAIGLVQLSMRAEILDGFSRVQAAYDRLLKIADTWHAGRAISHVSRVYRLIDAAPLGGMARVQSALGKAGIESRQWYGPGLHLEPAFQNLPRDPLPVSEAVSARLVGLPVYRDMTDQEVEAVAAVIHRLQDGAAGISDCPRGAEPVPDLERR